ncbi:uncharacterized protein A1O9_07319 [Exophiala aquamarina CBS 119918]|uniref:Uncharacterized protein n=1 Tax=Exophiala aquamarina CBS 119918 TaxID=1182545 RepID=A0A072PAI7_9EURO|nr:uncharacterized protein A1O9_07319 [Exophiala aquamarina CBS 119918]KEF57129.1 hypothetical protein A1O9_07319 [Exophiala aquamarina CBS 119918]
MRFGFSLGDIPSKHIPKLANILQFRPKEDRQDQEQRIKTTIKTLPSKLKGPGRLVRLLFHPCIDSCDWHKGLNRCVTDVILHHIQIEVGIRLNSLVSHSELLTEEQIDRVSRLRDLHALWLEHDTFEKTFLVPSHTIPWRYQASKCDACILSCIAGNMQTLLDLRCIVRSRATNKHVAKHGNPRLQVWVDAWMHSMVTHIQNVTGQPVLMDSQLEKNERQAIELKRLRSKIHSLKKKLQNAGPHCQSVKTSFAKSVQTFEADDGIVEDNGEEIVPTKQARRKEMGDLDEDGGDADLASVDAYTALMSGEHLPSTQLPRTQYRRPYISDEPESSRRPQTALHDEKAAQERKQQTEEVYVPPRQNWNKQPPAYPSAAGRPQRPIAASRRESWESVIFDSNFVGSVITNQLSFAARQTQHQQRKSAEPASSRYTSEQAQYSTRRETFSGGKPQPSPADEYINILPPFRDDDPRGDGKANIAWQDYSSATKSSRPITTIRERNSSAISPKTREPQHRFPEVRGRDNDNPSNTTQGFLRIYYDIARDLGHVDLNNTRNTSGRNRLASSTLGISEGSRGAMVPEGLKTPKRFDGQFPREKNGEGSNKPDAKHLAAHAKPDSARDKISREDDDRKAKDKTRESTSEKRRPSTRPCDQVSTGQQEGHVRNKGNGRLSHLARVGNDLAAQMQREDERQAHGSTRVKSVSANADGQPPERRTSNSTRRRGERSKPAAGPTIESDATTWSAGYGEQLRQKGDVSWFYHSQAQA